MKLKKTLIALLIMSMFTGLVLTEQTAAAKEQSLENSSMEASETITDDDEENSENSENKEKSAIAEIILETVEEVVDNATEENKKDRLEEKADKKKSEKAKKADKTKKSRKDDKKKPYTKAELRLMSAIIFCEAGNQPYAGKLAVGIVVVNRKESSSFPNTIREVIYSPYQFTPARNGALSAALARYDKGQFTSSDEKACIKAAQAALSGEKNVTYGGKTTNMKNFHFFSRYVSGARLTIGGHMFK